jgi:hypothetical protein
LPAFVAIPANVKRVEQVVAGAVAGRAWHKSAAVELFQSGGGNVNWGGLLGDSLLSLNRLMANDRASRIANHGYVIYDRNSGQLIKFGISSGKITANGQSYRALAQIRRWEQLGIYAPDALTTDTLENFSTRGQALDWEVDTVDFFTRLNGGIRLPRQWRP